MGFYLHIYRVLVKMNISALLAYRAGFVNSLISVSLWAIFQMVWVLLLTVQINSFYGWTRSELIFLTANYVFIFIGIFHLLFSRNFDRMAAIIDRGDLDYFLLKPVDSQFLLTLWQFNTANLIRLIIGVPVMIYLVISLGFVVNPLSIFNYLVFTVFSLVLMYSMWLLFCTLIIWNPRLTNIPGLLYSVNGISRFPPEIIYEFKNFFLFLLVPFTIMNAFPAKALFQKILAREAIFLIVISLLLFYVSRKFWQFSLRHYTSASS